MKRLLGACALLLGLAACHSQTSQPPATKAADAPAASPAAATDAPGTSYRVYRGRLPGQADSITLHLVAMPRIFDEAGTAHVGSYYGADGHPYSLQGQTTAAPDSVVLFDTSPEKAVSAAGTDLYWRLRQLPGPGGGLAGTVGGQPVRLRRVLPAAGALRFVVRYFADSAAAFPKEAKSPKGRISLQALVPVGGPANVRQLLEANLVRGIRGDTLSDLPTEGLTALYKQQRQQFFDDYRADAADLRPAPADTAKYGPYGLAMNYESQASCSVFYQQGAILSVGFFTYEFSGGAHGNYGTTGASYDLRTGRRLHYDDIFRPTAQAQLPALLAQAVRSLVGLKPGEPLDQALFVKQMPVTHNVFLTAGGVEFIYAPYEIASYAQGEIRVFLPLAQVRPLLREGLPLPGTMVATR